MKASMTAILATALALLLASCAMDMGQGARYGAYGGPARAQTAEPPFSLEEVGIGGVRWFPTHVRFAPDSRHILVSLCHARRPELCRIGKYFIETNEWEILPYEDKRTYRWPVYSPDGREIAVSTGACDEYYRCDLYRQVLARMRPDGSGLETVAEIAASQMSFSPDGRKLIYWRSGGAGPQGRRAEFSNIYEMDWATWKERALTQVIHNRPYGGGRPFFIDGGEAFVYFDFEGINPTMRFVSLKEVPLTPYTRGNFTRLWPRDDPEWRGGQNKVFDVGPNNRLLYGANLALRRAGGDLSVMVKDPKSNEAAFLVRARSETRDMAAFVKLDSAYDAALSPDLKRVAYLSGSPHSYHPTNKGLAIVEQGEVQPIYIAWPKLELKPGRQSASQQH